MGSASQVPCPTHLLFQKAWSTNSIELYEKRVYNPFGSAPQSFIRELTIIGPKPPSGSKQTRF
jgi:hypothetical protein